MGIGASSSSAPRGLDVFVVTSERQREADAALAMLYYTTNTPPDRADSAAQRKYSALLGHKSPSANQIRGPLLDNAYSSVRQEVLKVLQNTRYAIVTDGWSKRAALRGAPLINVMICPDSRPAVFWKVVNVEGCIKNHKFVYDLHVSLREEIESELPDAQCIGFIMNSTATNHKAMKE